MTPARRFALFRILALLEIAVALACVIWAFQGGEGVLGVILVMTLLYAYAAGFLVALIGVMAKLRQPLMVVSLAVHALIGLLMWFSPSIDKWISQRRQEEFRRMRTEQPAESDH